jgi:hypothetical protein
MNPILSPTFSQIKSCEHPPSYLANFFGMITKSFLHILGKVTANAYL